MPDNGFFEKAREMAEADFPAEQGHAPEAPETDEAPTEAVETPAQSDEIAEEDKEPLPGWGAD